MANIKISELNNISEINTNDIIPIVDISADETKKISMGNILDLFYPVGSYYETSNTTFDPNTSWGGTWVEDTTGRVTVALDGSQNEFNSIGKIGGNKYLQEHTHQVNVSSSNNHNSLYWTEFNNFGSSPGWGTSFSPDRSADTTNWFWAATTGTGDSGNLQPYVVVKRWHRTA